MYTYIVVVSFFFQAEDGIRDLVRSRGLGDVYKRQLWYSILSTYLPEDVVEGTPMDVYFDEDRVAREIPPCTPAGACAPKAAVLTPPSSTEDPTAY